MNTFRVGEVEIHRQVISKLLLELNVSRINSWVSVVLAKYANGRECRKAAGWWDIHDVGPHRQPLTAATTEGRSAGDSKLLHAVVSNRTNLRQHVLPAVIYAGVGAQH